MDFRQIPHGSPAYQETVALRDTILRAPLGLTFTREQLDAEETDFHLVAEIGDDIIACLVLSPIANRPALLHLRQMAVANSNRGQGIGRKLMNFAEEFARKQGATEIRRHAREHAIPFYQKFDYQPLGPLFNEVTLPHQEMRKPL